MNTNSVIGKPNAAPFIVIRDGEFHVYHDGALILRTESRQEADRMRDYLAEQEGGF